MSFCKHVHTAELLNVYFRISTVFQLPVGQIQGKPSPIAQEGPQKRHLKKRWN